MSQVTTPRGIDKKLYAAQQTASSITASVFTATEPTGDGYFNCGNTGAGGGNFNFITLSIFGVGNADTAGTALVEGFRKCEDGGWKPVKLLALAWTLGTAVGAASMAVSATEKFADTITASTAFTSANEIISPADNSIAMVKFDPCGCDFIRVQGAKGTATSFNVLAAGF